MFTLDFDTYYGDGRDDYVAVLPGISSSLFVLTQKAGAEVEITEAMIETGAELLLCEFGGNAMNHF